MALVTLCEIIYAAAHKVLLISYLKLGVRLGHRLEQIVRQDVADIKGPLLLFLLGLR